MIGAWERKHDVTPNGVQTPTSYINYRDATPPGFYYYFLSYKDYIWGFKYQNPARDGISVATVIAGG